MDESQSELPDSDGGNSAVEDEAPPSQRAENARRAFRAAVGSIVLLPLELFASRQTIAVQMVSFLPGLILFPYTTWLLCKVFNSTETLERKPRRLAIWATCINLSILLFGFLFLGSLFLPRTPWQPRPRDFAHPKEITGLWECKHAGVEMEIWPNGKFLYRQTEPQIEFSGTWGVGDFMLVFDVRRRQKGDGFEEGQVYHFDIDHFNENEILVQGRAEKLRFVRKMSKQK
jgi:hypothetical protein